MLAVKLGQLCDSQEIDEIVVSSNDPVVLRIARDWAPGAGKSVTVVERPQHLCIASTSIDDVAIHACDIIGEATIVWAFVTSPMVGAADYDAMIKTYEGAISSGSHDSLMTVTPMHRFLWTANGPYNYQREPLKWPRSQDLPVLYEANQASFILSSEVSRRHADRIGSNPLFFEIGAWKAIDVDWEEDFEIAEVVYRAERAKR